MSSSPVFKIHPAIGVARVGNSQDYYLAPEAAGGLPLEKDGQTPVTEFRDKEGARGIRRQAARFQVYVYDEKSPQGRPVRPGEAGVLDIRWTVHLANKKASWYEFRQLAGADGNHQLVENDQGQRRTVAQPLRNPRALGAERNQYIIDAGPRVVSCLGMDATPQEADFAQGTARDGYPETFPPAGLIPEGNDITTLGQISADRDGFLTVRGGLGHSGCSVAYDLTDALITNLVGDGTITEDTAHTLAPIVNKGYGDQASFKAALQGVLGSDDATVQTLLGAAYAQPRLDDYANNNFWWDDTSDGPVTATLLLEGGGTPVEATSSWVLVAPPAYAPQILNMVTLYDTLYDLFVREWKYNTALYDPTVHPAPGWNPTYIPHFAAEIQPITDRPAAYQWVFPVDREGGRAHKGLVLAHQRPGAFFAKLRHPEASNTLSPTLMPMLAGDDPISDYPQSKYLTLTRTQYFLMGRFSQNVCDTSPVEDPSGPGVRWDRAVLENCVGGPFCPGIEMTWLCRDSRIYQEPFRIKPKRPGSSGLQWNSEPTAGLGLEPGDITKYMALPWQADFNECAGQTIDNTTLWWWPAQRPYFVQTLGEDGQTTPGYWSPGAENPLFGFEKDELMVYNWKDLGFILQREQDGEPRFLEVQRLPLTRPHADG
ncbi:LodA/GoxA family CTQ-dependent oxidase [Archangium primigenium]|uniref:LodA/GoxA family CTQ-dependent oxidase n=1 Tax=[Archangium] primigenium TaxID=2792470 RepID=UPI00195E89E5|nr:LodA/GoxA family CTQ-dependent oxidase [Archangium primigenium]MBM7119327.1 LodA/GoxA family CTQ-dependent oxidase [Archangium primigenium]